MIPLSRVSLSFYLFSRGMVYAAVYRDDFAIMGLVLASSHFYRPLRCSLAKSGVFSHPFEWDAHVSPILFLPSD
jgi:hypothetical protein